MTDSRKKEGILFVSEEAGHATTIHFSIARLKRLSSLVLSLLASTKNG